MVAGPYALERGGVVVGFGCSTGFWGGFAASSAVGNSRSALMPMSLGWGRSGMKD